MFRTKFITLSMSILLALFAGSAMAQAVGTMTELEGQVIVTHTNGQALTGAIDLDIQLGDQISTSENGRTTLVFHDQSSLNISYNTTLIVNRSIYDPDAQERSSLFNVVTGTVKVWVFGLFQEDEEYQIETPTAVTGLRGTGVIVTVFEDPRTGKPVSKFATIEGEQEVHGKADPTIKVKVGPKKFTTVPWNGVPHDPQDIALGTLDQLIERTTLGELSFGSRAKSFLASRGFDVGPGPEPGAPDFPDHIRPFGREIDPPNLLAPSDFVIPEPAIHPYSHHNGELPDGEHVLE